MLTDSLDCTQHKLILCLHHISWHVSIQSTRKLTARRLPWERYMILLGDRPGFSLINMVATAEIPKHAPEGILGWLPRLHAPSAVHCMLLCAPYAALLQYFGDPTLSLTQAKLRLADGVLSPNPALNQQTRLGIYGLGLTKVPWFTANYSYCSW